jgi:hypothetical protein
MVGDLTGRRAGEPVVDREPKAQGDSADVTMDDLEAAFASGDVTSVHAASFLAGRCEPEAAEDARALENLLGELLDSLDVEDLGSRALTYVEAAMSLALRGEHQRAMAALTDVAHGGRGTMGDHLAAFYLAELGDPSGYPTLVTQLHADNGWSRLMAARHLVGFIPFDGQRVGDETIDVRARMVERFDDVDELVAVEIPGLLVETELVGVEDTLARLAKEARHPAASRAAEHVLDDLRERTEAPRRTR